MKITTAWCEKLLMAPPYPVGGAPHASLAEAIAAGNACFEEGGGGDCAYFCLRAQGMIFDPIVAMREKAADWIESRSAILGPFAPEGVSSLVVSFNLFAKCVSAPVWGGGRLLRRLLFVVSCCAVCRWRRGQAAVFSQVILNGRLSHLFMTARLSWLVMLARRT